MKTVMYYDYVRNRKSLLQNLLVWTVLLLLLFMVSLIVEKIVPGFNREYLKWPDMAKNLLAVGNWNNHIYINLWQIISLAFPIYMIYTVMNGLSCTVVQEDRLETMVFLQNMSVGRVQVLLSKLLFWMGYAFIIYVALMIENILFFLILGSKYNLLIVVKHYGMLFFVTVIYLMVSIFLASYSKHENRCGDSINWILFLSLILSKVGAFVHFVVDLMTMKGQEGDIIGKVDGVADKLDVLTILCPAAWCWNGMKISGAHVVCGVIMAIFLCLGAFWIYAGRRNQ